MQKVLKHKNIQKYHLYKAEWLLSLGEGFGLGSKQAFFHNLGIPCSQ